MTVEPRSNTVGWCGVRPHATHGVIPYTGAGACRRQRPIGPSPVVAQHEIALSQSEVGGVLGEPAPISRIRGLQIGYGLRRQLLERRTVRIAREAVQDSQGERLALGASLEDIHG